MRGWMRRCGIVVTLFLLCADLPPLRAAGNHRMIVLTDMLGEPDDSQTMVRLLMYADEMDIEGLIATSISPPGYPAKTPYQPHRVGVHPEAIVSHIEMYGLVRDNLMKHAPGWPTKEYLLSKVGAGPYGYGMAAVGDGNSTPGSRLIVAAVEKPDPRPVYICINAGANPLAQALWDYRKTHTLEQVKAFIAKIRVYDDFGQDDAGAWICHEFPDVMWIRSFRQVFGLMGPGPPHIPPGFSSTARDPYVWQPFPPTDEGQHQWMKAHVQTGHGPLGATYPDRMGNGRFRYLEGGGTSTWIGLVNKGLYDPEQITWGGRYQPKKVPISAGMARVHDFPPGEEPYKPFYMYADASDEWTDPETGKTYNDLWTPIRRWRRAYQNDFQARMDWCVKEYADANHNPIAAFRGEPGAAMVRLKAKAGEHIPLDATGSRDPDNDALEFRWFVYPEAGTYRGAAPIVRDKEEMAELAVPRDAAGKQIHVILEVKDRNRIVSLYAYRRVVIDVE